MMAKSKKSIYDQYGIKGCEGTLIYNSSVSMHYKEPSEEKMCRSKSQQRLNGIEGRRKGK